MTTAWPQSLGFSSSLNPPALPPTPPLSLPHPVWSSQTDPHCLFCLSPERLQGPGWANKKGSSGVSPYRKAPTQAKKRGGKGDRERGLAGTAAMLKEPSPSHSSTVPCCPLPNVGAVSAGVCRAVSWLRRSWSKPSAWLNSVMAHKWRIEWMFTCQVEGSSH